MSNLVLIVGSNPLPNYLAAQLIEWDRAALYYTSETEQVKDRLVEALGRRWPERRLSCRGISDSTRAEAVHNAWREAETGDVKLHYTGGTKSMAVHLHEEWRASGGKTENASYIDDSKSLLRFDDGRDVELDEVGIELDLETLARLHGLGDLRARRIEGSSTPSPEGPQLPEDAIALAMRLIDEPALAKDLYERAKNKGKHLKSEPLDLKKHGIGLSVAKIPEPEWTNNQLKPWAELVAGEWLEEWVAHLISQTISDPVHVGVRARLVNRELEVDVITIRGHRLYLISCTTSSEIRLCKHKLFEVAMRARQLGGDLARSALACLLDGLDDQGRNKIGELQKDVAATWGAPFEPKVFGRAHLAEWLAGQTHSLESWLGS